MCFWFFGGSDLRRQWAFEGVAGNLQCSFLRPMCTAGTNHPAGLSGNCGEGYQCEVLGWIVELNRNGLF